MNTIYGYCRISTAKQKIDRQVRNIQNQYPTAIIKTEVYTGTKLDTRIEWTKIYKAVKQGDTIVFDSVSRMSRNADDGFNLYQELFDKGVDLIFLKEPHINTTTYKKALNSNIQLTGTNVDSILKGVNEYLMLLAQEQIKLAFIQAEKEVIDLQERTKEGIVTARLNGKQIGQKQGTKLTTKKSEQAKRLIQKHNIDFGGSLTDAETITMCNISRNSYYKYKRELKE